ncbi:hypothetical protein N3Z17_00545 [Candidatus Bandiella numerosa]|uniref:hypothetical protein n=1 Tax=Candidatus Bandiella numerosa TaxID=2570586 RepID=UPI00249E5F75|nr:hypothetical protein [Candidatus Bandiella numerosa]WHA05039.1 hypothetical protein N3Z17_00545 [Candidatus Bandiella numerosa]
MALLDLKDFRSQIEKVSSLLKNKFNVIPKFGVEIEFYLRHKNGKLASAEQIDKFKEELRKRNLAISDERGLDQFETQLKASSNCLELIELIKKIKLDLHEVSNKLSLLITFSPKPFAGTYGSSMHFHLSLYDNHNHNLFSDDTISTNKFLSNVVNSILLILNQSIYLLCGDDFEEYSRFTPNFMAPVNLSWGNNNRTTAVRIPDGDISSRRLEFRIPSASCDPQKAIFFLLVAVLNALTNPKATIDRVYGNAADPQYKFQDLFTNPTTAKNHYNLDNIYSQLCI